MGELPHRSALHQAAAALDARGVLTDGAKPAEALAAYDVPLDEFTELMASVRAQVRAALRNEQLAVVDMFIAGFFLGVEFERVRDG